MLFPELFEEYQSHIPVEERVDMMGAYYKRLNGDDEEEMLRCAAAWSKWENAISKLDFDPEYVKKAIEDPHW